MSTKNNKGGNVFERRMEELDTVIEQKEASLQALQEELRANPYNAELRAKVQAAKVPLIELANERGEIARSISRMAGGKQYAPPIG